MGGHPIHSQYRCGHGQVVPKVLQCGHLFLATKPRTRNSRERPALDGIDQRMSDMPTLGIDVILQQCSKPRRRSFPDPVVINRRDSQSLSPFSAVPRALFVRLPQFPAREPPQDLRIHVRAHRSLIRLPTHERGLSAPADLEFELRSINRSLQERRYLFHCLRLPMGQQPATPARARSEIQNRSSSINSVHPDHRHVNLRVWK